MTVGGVGMSAAIRRSRWALRAGRAEELRMEPPAAAGPVGPRRSTAGLPVKGAALRSASLRDGLAAAL